MTANPARREIADNLHEPESAHDRPDLVARVSHLKVKVLLDLLLQQNVLGRVVAWTYVIEFQKRGLPHIHLLLIVRPSDKPRTPADVDKCICAELPNAEDPNQQELHNIIRCSQVHGPCGVRNPKCVCMEDGACTKGYPKDFA